MSFCRALSQQFFFALSWEDYHSFLGIMHPWSRAVWWVTIFWFVFEYNFVILLCFIHLWWVVLIIMIFFIFSYLSFMQNPNEGDTSDITMGIICYDDNRAKNLEWPQLNPSRLGIILEGCTKMLLFPWLLVMLLFLMPWFQLQFNRNMLLQCCLLLKMWKREVAVIYLLFYCFVIKYIKYTALIARKAGFSVYLTYIKFRQLYFSVEHTSFSLIDYLKQLSVNNFKMLHFDNLTFEFIIIKEVQVNNPNILRQSLVANGLCITYPGKLDLYSVPHWGSCTKSGEHIRFAFGNMESGIIYL